MRGQKEEPAGATGRAQREDIQAVRRTEAATWRIHSVERLSYGALAASFQLEIAEIVTIRCALFAPTGQAPFVSPTKVRNGFGRFEGVATLEPQFAEDVLGAVVARLDADEQRAL